MAPRPKKAAAGQAHLVLSGESGLLLNPLVRRTWAVRGQTPISGGDGGHRERVPVVGAVSVSPLARHLGRYFATLPDGFVTAGAVVGFLRNLLEHLRGEVVVVWDGGGDHTGPLVRAVVERNRRLTPERLPAYAPALNPVEAGWSWLKYGQRANDVPDGMPELDDEVVDRRVELKFDPGLLRVLRERSDLPFPRSRVKQPCLPAGQ